MTRFVVGIFSVGMMVLCAGVVLGETYPNKPIRLVTGGGGGALMARLIASGISLPLGQTVIVENRPAPAIPVIVARAPPDGYTALISGNAVWLAPLTIKAQYDPVRDLAPISMVGRQPLILFVHPSLPVKSVKELIAYAKTRPGELNNSIGGIGGGIHLAGELFKSMADVNIVSVPYSSTSLEIQDLVGGRVQLAITTPASMMEQAKSGKLRALAVTTAEPSVLFPGLPTIAASLPGYEAAQTVAMFATARTPAAIVNRLNQEVVRVLSQPDVKQNIFDAGIEVVGSSPEQLAATVKSDMGRMGKVIKDAGIKAD